MPPQHRPHRLSASPTISPQARQRGGSTASTTARPIRSKRLEAQPAKLADACIDTHHQVADPFVNGRLRERRVARHRDTEARRRDGANLTSEPILLFDRRAWRLHRDRAARGACVEFLHAEIAGRLVDRLNDVAQECPVALDLGSHHGALSRALDGRAGVERVVTADPSIRFLARLGGIRVATDPDLVPFRDRSFDLVASALVLHWAGDLPGTLVQIRRVLKPGGLFLAAMLGGSSLIELRTVLIEAEVIEEGGASPRVSPATDLGDAAALLLRTGFAMPVADAEKITVTYPDALALMRDLRGMGETNALSARRRTPLRRTTLARAGMLYAERFGLPDDRIPATFEILFLTGRAPGAKG
jgi:NADH dehydrogenase [ubiquinone] 1 alpha subcomplex assembly factor 5